MSDEAQVWDATITTAAKAITLLLRGLPPKTKATVMKVVDVLLEKNGSTADCNQCCQLIGTDTDNYVNFGSEEFSEWGILQEVCASCICKTYRRLDKLLEEAREDE